MFYTDVKLFKDQSESDHVLDDVACMVGCTRSCLNVVASDKGLVVGRVTFLEDGKEDTFVKRRLLCTMLVHKNQRLSAERLPVKSIAPVDKEATPLCLWSMVARPRRCGGEKHFIVSFSSFVSSLCT